MLHKKHFLKRFFLNLFEKMKKHLVIYSKMEYN